MMHYVTVDSCPAANNPAGTCVIRCDGEIHLHENTTEINQKELLQNSSTLLFVFFFTNSHN